MGKILLGIVVMVVGAMIHPVLALAGFAVFIWGVTGSARGLPRIDAFSQGYKYAFSNGKTGIAVCPERRIVKLKEKSKVKEYPFDMIRSWESNLATGGMVVHGGSNLTGAANVGAANLGQMMANKRASGFFVLTKDIDNVTWRVEMFSKKEQTKWMEIMQQCINES